MAAILGGGDSDILATAGDLDGAEHAEANPGLPEGVAAAAALLAGLYPAWRMGRTSPALALRARPDGNTSSAFRPYSDTSERTWEIGRASCRERV